MVGHRHKLGHVHYRCWPTNNNRGRPDKHADHPRTVHVREEAITTAVEDASASSWHGRTNALDYSAVWPIWPVVRQRVADLDVLDVLPYLAVNLGNAPENLQRRLYESTQLRVEVHPQRQEATVVITVPREGTTMISNAPPS
jgi:hypothetical protein